MNIAVFPTPEDNRARTLEDRRSRTFEPSQSRDMVIDWTRVGRYCQAKRTAAGLGRVAFARVVGLNAHQVGQVERELPISAYAFMRLCVHFGRDQTFFCKTLAGWNPHLPQC